MAVSSVFRSTSWALAVCTGLWLVPPARAESPTPVPAASAAPAPGAVPAAPAAPAALSPEAHAESDLTSAGSSAAAAEDVNEGLGWMLGRTLLVFGGVMALIYLTLNVGLRKLMGLQGVPVRQQPLVSLVERVPLDQRRTLFVVKAAGDYLLLGGGENGLQMLSKLDTQAVEHLRTEPPASNVTPLSPFLQKLIARRAVVPAPASPPPSVPRPPDAA